MKKSALLFIGLFSAFMLFAQTPAAFNYQAVVRDAAGAVLQDQTVSFRISILAGSSEGSVVFRESHAATTNSFGLVNLVVGEGDNISGSIAGINWSGNTHHLKVEVDPSGGTAFSPMGVSQLISVPYSLNAKTVEEIPDNLVSTSKIAAGAVTGDKIAQSGANSGQVLKWTGTAWVPADDLSGSGDDTWQTSGNNVYRPAGNVGVGTSTPVAQLDVEGNGTGEGNVLFAGAAKTSNPGDPPISGEGTRLMWYPDKAAFRAGYVGGTRWDKNNIGNYSVAFGYGPLASGAYSFAVGVSPTASGSYSTALGTMTIASGSNSTAMGSSAEASGQWSVAMGNHTAASGANSTAMGKETFASGDNSTAIGRLVRAYSFCETVIGYSNTPYTPENVTGWNPNDRLFVIGNGGTTSSNAMTVLKSGNTGIGTDTPQAGLHIRGDGFPASFMYLEANVGNDAGIRLYEGKSDKWHIFNNSGAGGLQIYNTDGNTAIFAKQSNSFVGLGTTKPTQKLHVVGNAYKTEGGTAWATSSDLRLKTLTGKYEKGLEEIAALEAVRFIYNPGNARQLSSETEQVGFVAQEVQKIFPEAVAEAEDGYLDFNIHPVNIAMVNAIRELKAENDRLKVENEQIISRLERIEAQLAVAGHRVGN